MTCEDFAPRRFFFRLEFMELTPEQQDAIARLYENESLTENLDDQSARALLEWAQGQIAANADDSLVRAAVSAANSGSERGAEAVVLQADGFLAQALALRADAATRLNESATSNKMSDSSAPTTDPTGDAIPAPVTTSAEIEMTGRASTNSDARLQASAAVPETAALVANASAEIGPTAPNPAPPLAPKRKKRRKIRRSKRK